MKTNEPTLVLDYARLPVDTSRLGTFQRFQAALVMTGLDADSLAAQTRISRALVRRMVSGRSLVSLEVLLHLRVTMGISLDWLLVGAGPPFMQDAVPVATDPRAERRTAAGAVQAEALHARLKAALELVDLLEATDPAAFERFRFYVESIPRLRR